MTSPHLNVTTAAELLHTATTLRAQVADDADRLLRKWGAEQSDAVANLAAYVALRQHDLRSMQQRVEDIGLSPLHCPQEDVLGQLDRLIYNLKLHCGERATKPPPQVSPHAHDRPLVLDTDQGPAWMVTLPSEIATNPRFAERLVAHGMSIARVNCARDDGQAWLAMIEHVRAAALLHHRSVQVLVELAGRKVRMSAVKSAEGRERIHPRDTLLLTRGDFATLTDYPTQAAVNIPNVLDALQIGDPVSIDDGHASGVVERVVDAGVVVRVNRARAKGARIRPNKGLNFPTADIVGPALQQSDLADLDLLLEHTDLVGLSFVQSADDLRSLQQALQCRLGERATGYGMVAKIETPAGIQRLPEIIAAAAGRPLAIMIARGDLGVELGFAALAEAQETIQNLCEAARVPVIWATEVLGHFIKHGTHARGELTDAALGTLANCVMLNKGPFVCDALDCLRQLATTTRANRTRPGTRLAPLAMFANE